MTHSPRCRNVGLDDLEDGAAVSLDEARIPQAALDARKRSRIRGAFHFLIRIGVEFLARPTCERRVPSCSRCEQH